MCTSIQEENVMSPFETIFIIIRYLIRLFLLRGPVVLE